MPPQLAINVQSVCTVHSSLAAANVVFYQLRTVQTSDIHLHTIMTANCVAMRHVQPVESLYERLYFTAKKLGQIYIYKFKKIGPIYIHVFKEIRSYLLYICSKKLGPIYLRIDRKFYSFHEEIISIRLNTPCNPRSVLRKGVYNLIEVNSNEPNT
jgi:hypothetical protein